MRRPGATSTLSRVRREHFGHLRPKTEYFTGINIFGEALWAANDDLDDSQAVPVTADWRSAPSTTVPWWSPSGELLWVSVANYPSIGNFSVAYVAALRIWVMMYDCSYPWSTGSIRFLWAHNACRGPGWGSLRTVPARSP